MTARKIHFDFHNENAAWCGATPREGAAALEITEGADEVTCLLCQALIADIDAEMNIARLTYNAEYDMPAEPQINPKYTDEAIASRHGLDSAIVLLARVEGILKR